ncbi:cation transport protein-domain-containing protein [Pseudoneurospora amorphoporcata]|uniref:Potassium transport protein n=1 Tax=Pseudoneurospora amorphoporcata TaxID=241081 RepID=A0AAN6SKP0_9PEZI|nr:cation transport protein-domain-containing protein [Pseudoneurospora amorphoporcata]
MERLRDIVQDRWMRIRHRIGFQPRRLVTETHFRYQTVHYTLIISLTILGSILIYASHRGEMAYVDALFFAAGSCTQGGLNTVDLNLINTFSQVVIFFLTMLTNPMAIGYYTVSLRRYWFEKKLQSIVQDAKQRRGTISKSKSQMRADMLSQAERGVAGRQITVMHGSGSPRMTNDGIMLGSFNKPTYDSRAPPEQRDPDQRDPDQPEDTRRQPEIRFAGTVKKSDGLGMDAIKLPPLRTDEEHIAILERQRNRDDEVLRIPGPRDMERGAKPRRVDDSADEDDRDPAQPTPLAMLNSRPQAITIEEPDRNKLHETLAEDIVNDAKTLTHSFAPQINHLKFRRNTRTSTTNRVDEEADPKLQRTNSRMSRRASLSAMRSAFTRDKMEPTPYLSWEPTLGRNSQFRDLTEEQREELGGIEYRVLKLLQKIILCYFFGFYLLGLVGLLPWILKEDRWGQVVDNAGQSRVWWAFFTTHSAFFDLGYTLTPDSMNSFNTAVWPLLLMAFLIILGNTGFPVMLRFIIWVMSIVVPRDSGLYEELRFLLDHPRRCFILLFPSGATWWLFFILVGLNTADVIFFVVLDLGSGPVVDLPAGIKVLNGFFEAASTRTAGFACINLAALHPAVKVSYMIMMYISVLPIAMSIRRTNVYEEMSLGIYHKHENEEGEGNNASPSSDLSYIGSHLRRQLSFDLWFIALFWFMLSISEGKRIMNGETDMFSLMFELISAYGTVGMSLGYSTGNASLSAIFSTAGKVFIIMTLIRGRHRGLPYGLDRAICLPKDLNSKSSSEDDRIERQGSHASAMSTGRDALSTTSKTSRRRHWRQRSNDIGGHIFGALLQPGPPRTATPNGHRHHNVPHPQTWHSGQFGSVGTNARHISRDSHPGSIGSGGPGGPGIFGGNGGLNGGGLGSGINQNGWHSMRRRATNPEQHHETIHEDFQFPPDPSGGGGDRRPASDQTDQTNLSSDQNTLTEASRQLGVDARHDPKLMKRKSEPSFPSTPTNFSE